MFINCPRDFLLRDYISLFPPKSVVVEILETIKPDQEIVDACQRLKQTGYTIALDDFVDSPGWAPLVALADIIKVDFRLTDPKEQRALVSRVRRQKHPTCSPKKWRPRRNIATAMQMGYSLFQGYFFCRPEMMQHRACLPSNWPTLNFCARRPLPNSISGNWPPKLSTRLRLLSGCCGT